MQKPRKKSPALFDRIVYRRIGRLLGYSDAELYRKAAELRSTGCIKRVKEGTNGVVYRILKYPTR